MQRSQARRLALSLIAAHNLAQNIFFNRRGYVESNILVLAALLTIGKVHGLSFGELGFRPRFERRDLRLSGLLAALTAGGSMAALAHPETRGLLRDERARDESGRLIAYKALVRFPIGTALFEEGSFRGVLPALTGRSGPSGDLVSAAVFGLWHVIPTSRALAASSLSNDLTPIGRAKTVMAGCATTSLAGLGFSWLRRRSGSIALPWLVHSAFNTITYLAGVVAWRLNRQTEPFGIYSPTDVM